MLAEPSSAGEHEKAIAEARALQDSRSEGAGLLFEAMALARPGSTAQARELCLEAVERLRDIGAGEELAQAVMVLGTIEMVLCHFDESRERLLDALELIRRAGDAKLEGQCVELLGVVAWKQGRVDEGWTLWQQALELHRRTGNRPKEGTVLRNLAAASSMQGRSEQSRELLLKALEIFREMGNRRDEGLALTNLGVTWWELGRHQEAEACYQQALEVQRSIGDRRNVGLTLDNLAMVVSERGELEAARDLYRRALDLFQEVGDQFSEAWNLREQAMLERRLGPDPAVAEALARESELRFTALGSDLESARSLCELGHAQVAVGHDAHPALQQAETLAGRMQGPPPHMLQTALDRLRAAILAAESGPSHRAEPTAELETRLYRGERVEDLPRPLRERLLHTGRLRPEAQPS